jgi:hypothetical protein
MGKHSDAKTIEILQKSQSTSRLLASGENAVLHWADDTTDLFSTFRAEMERYANVAGDLPAEWHMRTSSQYVAERVFGSGAVLLRCMHAISNSLEDPTRALFHSFIDVPWRYSLFAVKEKVADTVFQIHDYGIGEAPLLQSASLESLHKKGLALFLTLLFNNGLCYQTYGPLHSFRGFQPDDFVSLSRMIQPRAFTKGGVGAAIARNPIPFLLLSRWSETPPVTHGGRPVEFCFHSTRSTRFDADSVAASLGATLDRKGDVSRLSLPAQGNPFNFAHVYHDAHSGEVAVHTTGMNYYEAIRRVLSPDIQLPQSPDWRATANMCAVISLMHHKEQPGERWAKLFDAMEEPGQESGLEALNAFAAEMTDCSNRGLPFDLEEAERRFGVPLDDAKEMHKVLARTAQRFDIRLEGGLPGFSPPPPITRLKIKTSLEDSQLFRFEMGGRARELFEEHAPRLAGLARSVGKETPALEELPDILEDLCLKYWKATDPTILSYTLFMLAGAGAVLRPAADYAVETLRIFWQVLISGHGKKQVARFVDRYEMFCEEILAPTGLVVLADSDEEGRGGAGTSSVSSPFRLLVARSDFFDAWVSLIDR